MSAEFSINKEHRYQLTRNIIQPHDVKPLIIGFCGINPSIAGAITNDHTIRKLMEFGRLHGATKIIVFNAFTKIATDVKELANAEYPNDFTANEWLRSSIAFCDIVVPMWGSRHKVPERLRSRFDEVLDFMHRGGDIRCFGITQRGDPMHPLMLGYKTQLVDYHNAMKQWGGEL